MRGCAFDLFSLGCGRDFMVYPWHAYHFVFVIPKKALGEGGRGVGGGVVSSQVHELEFGHLFG